MATEITKAEMLEIYEQGLGFDFINTGNRIYCRMTRAQGNNPQGNTVVYAAL